MQNVIIKQFLVLNDINVKEVNNKVDTKIHKTKEYLGLLSNSIVLKPSYFDEVSIGDIYGIENCKDEESIFDLLLKLYSSEKNNNSRNTRSNQYLLLSSKKMIENSNESNEYISVNKIDCDNNIYLISSNGMHRYAALRCIYLSLISKYPNQIKQIKEKFKLKVKVSQIDELRTYCLFIIKNYYKDYNKQVGYKLEYINNNYSGKIKIGIIEDGKVNEEYIFNDEELIEFIKPMVLEKIEYFKTIDNLNFQSFIKSLNIKKISI